MRTLMLVAALGLLAVPAGIAGTPAKAAASCTTWSATMQEDEGGPVLMAEACATDFADAYLTLTCSGGQVYVRYDLLAGSDAQPQPGDAAQVSFRVGDQADVLPLVYEDMDGRYAGDVGMNAPIVNMIASGSSLIVADADGKFRQHQFSLAGSGKAIAAIRAACD